MDRQQNTAITNHNNPDWVPEDYVCNDCGSATSRNRITGKIRCMGCFEHVADAIPDEAQIAGQLKLSQDGQKYADRLRKAMEEEKARLEAEERASRFIGYSLGL